MIAATDSPEAHGWMRVVSPESPSPDGVVTYRLESWFAFHNFLETEVFNPSSGAKHRYIWRGQRKSDWPLRSSLDRLFGKLGLLRSDEPSPEERSKSHLDSFRYAARGLRGPNPAALLENDLWALGQHFGLATPLLDWTRSPFVAAYFAFEELTEDVTEYRVVYALDQNAVKQKSEELLEGESFEKGRPLVVEFVDPLSDENQRLVSQGGLFTRAPIGSPINEWVRREFQGETAAVLLEIQIPNFDRLNCLRALNRMNVNHLSLFPDLSGASRSTNLRVELELEPLNSSRR